MFYQLVSLCCLCVLIWRLWFKKQSTFDPPELSGRIPIVGHAYKVVGDGVKQHTFFRAISAECLEKGGILTVHLGPYKLYVVTDPEDCLTIMNTSLQKHFFFSFMKLYLGNGLITADVHTWKKNRKLLNPAFNQQVLDGFMEIFNSQARRLVKQFATEVGKPFDHEILLRINNLETICSTALGVQADEYRDLHVQYLPLLTKMIVNVNERIQKFWLYNDFIYNMTQRKKKLDETVKQAVVLSTSIIEKKKSDKTNLTNTDNKAGKFKSFMDHILDLASNTGCFTDEQIREETDNIISGGHDTTASLLTFTLTILGSHPDIQEKVYKEIQCVLGNSEKPIDKDDLAQLVYVEAVLKEVLRFQPVVPVIPRHIEKDVKLKNYTVKANTDCLILAYGLHRHGIWGPDAGQFRPERWLDKGTLPDLKYYGAFGLGRRACIGKVYAMMSMKILLAYVLRSYRISSDASKMVVQMYIMARPESGHHITLTARNS